jgi:DNA-binding LytR/AlgR family response regulator
MKKYKRRQTLKRLIKCLVFILLLLLVHIHAQLQLQGQDEPANDDSRSVELQGKQIKWMESDRNYIDLHTENTNRPYRIRETLQNLETRLDPEKFVRVNRSTIINIAFIKEMQPMFIKEYVVIFKTGERFILNKKYFSHLESLLKL